MTATTTRLERAVAAYTDLGAVPVLTALRGGDPIDLVGLARKLGLDISAVERRADLLRRADRYEGEARSTALVDAVAAGRVDVVGDGWLAEVERAQHRAGIAAHAAAVLRAGAERLPAAVAETVFADHGPALEALADEGDLDAVRLLVRMHADETTSEVDVWRWRDPPTPTGRPWLDSCG